MGEPVFDGSGEVDRTFGEGLNGGAFGVDVGWGAVPGDGGGELKGIGVDAGAVVGVVDDDLWGGGRDGGAGDRREEGDRRRLSIDGQGEGSGIGGVACAVLDGGGDVGVFLVCQRRGERAGG